MVMIDFKHPRTSLIQIMKDIFQWLPDKQYIHLLFRLSFGYKLNLKNPQTFSEKLQWLKLYDRNPDYVKMVDKIEVKDYVSNIIGKDFIIPTLGVWDHAEDINWDALPNQFVLKCNHDSGGVIICKDKSKLDKEAVIKRLNKSLLTDYYKVGREWPYKDVQRRILAEKYIEPLPNMEDLPDYKFFCFDGEVKAMFIATDRQKPNEEVKFDFFDANFNHLPFRQGHENADHLPSKPKLFEIMKDAAAKLSKGIPQVRVDFYEIGNRVLFGEMTLFHFSGFMPFRPEQWDYYFGEMLNLPNTK